MYINSKSKTKEGIGNVLKDPSEKNSVLVEKDKEKAEVLTDYFPVCSQKSPQVLYQPW